MMEIEVRLKIGREICTINESDIVMDNGSCVQLISRKKHQVWNLYSINMSKKMFSDLKKNGYLYTNKELEDMAAEKYYSSVVLYKFDVERMKQAGY